MTSRNKARAAALAAFLAAACRRGMEVQPKVLPLQESSFFADGRSARPRPAGAVARGEGEGSWPTDGPDADRFPFPIAAADLARGRERYEAFCAPCHDRAGGGDGMIVRRGFPRPPSYHEARLRAAPAGHFVAVIERGYGRMYPFADRVGEADRWRVAAYIRALQFASAASLSDAPPRERAALEAAP